MTEENNQPKKVDLSGKIVGEIELENINVEEFIGQKVQIEGYETLEGKYGYFVTFKTQAVKVVPQEDRDDIEIRATRNFGLQTDKDGNIGWGKETKLGLFLDKYEAENLDQVIGKEVTIQAKDGKDGKTYLTFL